MTGDDSNDGAERSKDAGYALPGGRTKPYWNPYVAGTGLGLTLLAAFLVLGRGLGVSGGLTSIVAFAVNIVAPDHAQSNGMLYSYLDNTGRHPLNDWMVFVILGIVVGGFVSGRLGGRIQRSIVKGPRISSSRRMLLAFAGGLAMGFAAKMARGCTSGQALTGGALLSVGSWIFMISMFIGAFAFARVVRRQWM